MAVPTLIAARALGSSSASVGPTTGIDTTGATALRVWVVTQQLAAPTVTDSKSSTWAADGSAVLLSSGFTGYVHCMKATGTVVVGTGHTFSATGTSSSSIFAAGFGPSGGGTLSFTTWTAQADATSPYDSPATTPSGGADVLLITFGADDGSGSPVTLTWGNSFTTVTNGTVTDQTNFWGGALAQRSVTGASGSYNSTFTSNSTSRTNAVVGILSFTESGGGDTLMAQACL